MELTEQVSWVADSDLGDCLEKVKVVAELEVAKEMEEVGVVKEGSKEEAVLEEADSVGSKEVAQLVVH